MTLDRKGKRQTGRTVFLARIQGQPHKKLVSETGRGKDRQEVGKNSNYNRKGRQEVGVYRQKMRKARQEI
jgi:hypothetical protein